MESIVEIVHQTFGWISQKVGTSLTRSDLGLAESKD